MKEAAQPGQCRLHLQLVIELSTKPPPCQLLQNSWCLAENLPESSLKDHDERFCKLNPTYGTAMLAIAIELSYWMDSRRDLHARTFW